MLMAFFGCEVKPNKPFSFSPSNPVKGRLHLSLATLGMGSSANKSILQCISGDARPVFLCSLFPDKYETCQLHLEFEEADDVVFSVIGPHSIHITGYYLGSAHHQPNDDSESYGEDIAATESERSSDDEDYGGSFINDGETGVYSTSSESMDGASVEKISCPSNSVKVKCRRLRKKYQLSKDGSGDKDRLQQHEDFNIRHKDHVSSDGNCAGYSFKSSSLPKKGSNLALVGDRHKGHESDSDSTGGFFISSSLLNKSHDISLTEKIDKDNLNMDRVGDVCDSALQMEPKSEALDEGTEEAKKKKKEKKNKSHDKSLTAKIDQDNLNMGQVGDASDSALQIEPKREALDEGTEEAKKKKKKKERKKRKLKLGEGTESSGIMKDGQDPEKEESNCKSKRKKKKSER